jgi:hypothetical protein
MKKIEKITIMDKLFVFNITKGHLQPFLIMYLTLLLAPKTDQDELIIL